MRAQPGGVIHGARHLPAVDVDAYNAELRDTGGFVGDRASSRAFAAILDDLRERLRRLERDPLGGEASREIDRNALDRVLAEGEPEAAGLVQAAVEAFARELVTVIRRFLRLDGWHDTQRIAIGGGFRASRLGELVAGRASVTLKSEGQAIDVRPIRHHPDEAGLIGCAHLPPRAALAGQGAMLAVDIGGTKIRAGRLALHLDRDPALGACAVERSAQWRHGDEHPDRDAAVDRLAGMLRDLAREAEGRIAPVIGIGCPGLIRPDGTIERGGQNLPGDWEDPGFNLPARLRERLPSLGGRPMLAVMHNDAVAQGLSQVPFMRDVEHWGVLTIGTGLGNARFTNCDRAGTGK